ncbi:MAG: hypothetical protein ACRDXE_11070 [Acidimicrobiales bacterium]
MTDTEHPAPDRDPEPAAAAQTDPERASTGSADAAPDEAEAPDPEAPDAEALDVAPTRDAASVRRRRAAFATLRGVVVVVVAVVGYQALIPQTHIDRSRLKGLVVTQPGVKAFDIKPAGAAEQQAARIGLPAPAAAAKRDPHHTGVYSIEWTPTPSTGAGLVVFLLPKRADAATSLGQIRQRQLAADSYKADGLTRRTTFNVGGVPGSTGSVYAGSPSASASASHPVELSVVAFATGRVVSIVQVLDPSGTQADAVAVARTEYGHLRKVEPGFTLAKVTRPTVATVLWIVGSVLVLLLAVGWPWGRRALVARRRRREQARLDHMVRVGAQVITKRRR